MTGTSGAKIVISIPRIIASVIVVGIIVAGTQIDANPNNKQPLHVQTASSHQPSILSTPAPTTSAQTTTVPSTVAAQPIVSTAPAKNIAPAPVITPAATASVTGLAPTSSTGSAATSGYTSLNWSGYMATAASYSAVSGSWTVPAATGITGQASADATWIGIGGIKASDLIQVGTTDRVSPTGVETSVAFYELLPQNARTITSLAVSPGDVMKASLTEISNDYWDITITDTTTNKSYATARSYTSSNSSAEWVEEDPSQTATTLVPLDVFAPVAFTGSTTTAAGNSLTLVTSGAQPITLTSVTKQPIAIPSAIGNDNQSFTVTLNN